MAAFVRLAFFGLIFGLLAPLSPGRSEVVTWISTDPVYAEAKETTGSGQLIYLTSHLPNFSHRVIKASDARAIHELKSGAGVCNTNMFVTPEREKLFTFAKRRMALPGFRLLARRGGLAALSPAVNAKGEVDLDKLERLPGLTGAYTHSRQYGPAISAYIKRAPAGLNVEVANLQLFNLVETGRVDFAFVVPMDYYYFIPEQQRGAVVLLRVAGEAPVSHAAVACSNDALGRSVIQAIDTLLSDDSQWVTYVEPLRQWLPPEDFEILRAGH